MRLCRVIQATFGEPSLTKYAIRVCIIGDLASAPTNPTTDRTPERSGMTQYVVVIIGRLPPPRGGALQPGDSTFFLLLSAEEVARPNQGGDFLLCGSLANSQKTTTIILRVHLEKILVFFRNFNMQNLRHYTPSKSSEKVLTVQIRSIVFHSSFIIIHETDDIYILADCGRQKYRGQSHVGLTLVTQTARQTPRRIGTSRKCNCNVQIQEFKCDSRKFNWKF